MLNNYGIIFFLSYYHYNFQLLFSQPCILDIIQVGMGPAKKTCRDNCSIIYVDEICVYCMHQLVKVLWYLLRWQLCASLFTFILAHSEWFCCNLLISYHGSQSCAEKQSTFSFSLHFSYSNRVETDPFFMTCKSHAVGSQSWVESEVES